LCPEVRHGSTRCPCRSFFSIAEAGAGGFSLVNFALFDTRQSRHDLDGEVVFWAVKEQTCGVFDHRFHLIEATGLGV
jgi:hypothetical protein